MKLAAALDAFAIDPRGRICLDLGASTGGFTEVLLSRGAERVYAVDVGHGQLHPKLAADPRVVSLEATDARRLDRILVPEPIDLLVADVSFISLKLVLPPVVPLLAPDAALVALVKPQFEAGPAHRAEGRRARRGGAARAYATTSAPSSPRSASQVVGLIPSPILGGEGNREFLIGARRG